MRCRQAASARASLVSLLMHVRRRCGGRGVVESMLRSGRSAAVCRLGGARSRLGGGLPWSAARAVPVGGLWRGERWVQGTGSAHAQLKRGPVWWSRGPGWDRKAEEVILVGSTAPLLLALGVLLVDRLPPCAGLAGRRVGLFTRLNSQRSAGDAGRIGA